VAKRIASTMATIYISLLPALSPDSATRSTVGIESSLSCVKWREKAYEYLEQLLRSWHEYFGD